MVRRTSFDNNKDVCFLNLFPNLTKLVSASFGSNLSWNLFGVEKIKCIESLTDIPFVFLPHAEELFVNWYKADVMFDFVFSKWPLCSSVRLLWLFVPDFLFDASEPVLQAINHLTQHLPHRLEPICMHVEVGSLTHPQYVAGRFLSCRNSRLLSLPPMVRFIKYNGLVIRDLSL
jgi:hypothetical protein